MAVIMNNCEKTAKYARKCKILAEKEKNSQII
jgi:hypothetical protein